MPARDILWGPGMTLPWERMNDLTCALREGRGQIPNLRTSSMSTDAIADAVYNWFGTLSPSSTWGYDLGSQESLKRVESVMERPDVHWIQYEAQQMYHYPGVTTMVLAFICQIGALPEDEQVILPANALGADWPDGRRDARFIYRWRVRVNVRNNRPHVKVEKIQQFQKLAKTGRKTPDGNDEFDWRIFNTGGQNQLYAYQPQDGSWWSGADVSDWISTHALEIATAIEAVAWAAISVATLGAGTGAAAGVATVRAVAEITKKAATAAALGQPFDFGAFFAQLGAALASFVQVPGVSEIVNSLSAWAKTAGEAALRTFLSNGIISSFLSSGGGTLSNLVASGLRIYSQAKGWIDTVPQMLSAAKSIANIASSPQQAQQMLVAMAPSQVQGALDQMLGKLVAEVPDPKKAGAMALGLLKGASADLQARIDTVTKEVQQARDSLPANFRPWFDYGKKRVMSALQAPFYAQAAVQLGTSAQDLHDSVVIGIATAKKSIDAQLAVLEMVQVYGLRERYALFEAVEAVAPRYAGKP